MKKIIKYECTKEEVSELIKILKEGCMHINSCQDCLLDTECSGLPISESKGVAEEVLKNLYVKEVK